MSLSLFGIILGLVLLMFLAYKGYSIIWVAPVCAVVVAVLSGYAILDAYIGDYMKGMADYVLQWFPAFFLGAVYGKVMDLTGSARSLGNALVKLIGPRFAVAAVVIPCLLMTYGGISLFVVVFVIYPMGYSIYRAADLPRTLLPGAIATGAFGITMTAVPGTPQIQNLIPTDYYGTTTMAAPLLSLVACAVMLLPAYIYLEWRGGCASPAARACTLSPTPSTRKWITTPRLCPPGTGSPASSPWWSLCSCSTCSPGCSIALPALSWPPTTPSSSPWCAAFWWPAC